MFQDGSLKVTVICTWKLCAHQLSFGCLVATSTASTTWAGCIPKESADLPDSTTFTDDGGTGVGAQKDTRRAKEHYMQVIICLIWYWNGTLAVAPLQAAALGSGEAENSLGEILYSGEDGEQVRPGCSFWNK